MNNLEFQSDKVDLGKFPILSHSGNWNLHETKIISKLSLTSLFNGISNGIYFLFLNAFQGYLPESK